MFVPAPYRDADGSWTGELVRNNPLALLASNGTDGVPYLTHVPVILSPNSSRNSSDESPDTRALMNGQLWGHMNRANPHWSALVPGTPVVAVFAGPHGYLSPTVYARTPAAPTWNFTAVHVHAVLETVEPERPGEATLETVVATVRTFERDFGTGWSEAGSLDYFRRILPGVGAFRLTVTGVDGMFKLSQEQDAEVRGRVERSFAEQASAGHRAVAALMSRLPPSGCPHHAPAGEPAAPGRPGEGGRLPRAV